METLRKSPSTAGESVSWLLIRIEEEWIKCREDFNKVWADIYAKNHYKSLDHRSFYFKQQDSKDLSTKYKKKQRKKSPEEKVKMDDVLYSVAARKGCSTKKTKWNQVLSFGLPTWSQCSMFILDLKIFDMSKIVEISTRGATTNEGESDGSPGVDSVTFNNVKQGKPACNGDDNVSPKRVDSSKMLITEDSKNVLEESEGEAEGIEDANFISADGTYSDHIFLNAKPLAKRVASPLHDGGKKDCNVFYGNESFYALFRLHQVGLQFA
ncbi:paired amphipathic helix protein Sin3-like protein 2 isoform X1 [Tanacetum coccineum]|uniref:Paired amphipathic helix protein Sin3-like protein 2 isoform X1 n=1 Tax=Tanacetum coccineum TaxID=301880 RepID=A0ABQ5FD84_9ASTR